MSQVLQPRQATEFKGECGVVQCFSQFVVYSRASFVVCVSFSCVFVRWFVVRLMFVDLGLETLREFSRPLHRRKIKNVSRAHILQCVLDIRLRSLGRDSCAGIAVD